MSQFLAAELSQELFNILSYNYVPCSKQHRTSIMSLSRIFG